MKQTLLALKEAIELAIATGEVVELKVDPGMSHTLLDNLAFALGYSFSWVELPGGGRRLEGEGNFMLHLAPPPC